VKTEAPKKRKRKGPIGGKKKKAGGKKGRNLIGWVKCEEREMAFKLVGGRNRRRTDQKHDNYKTTIRKDGGKSQEYQTRRHNVTVWGAGQRGGGKRKEGTPSAVFLAAFGKREYQCR